jgi:hypothetical protein
VFWSGTLLFAEEKNMAFMDRVRRTGGLLWVAVGLLFQLVWFLGRSVLPGPVTLLLCAVVTALAVTVLSRSSRSVWIAGWTVAVLLGLDLFGAVADRFGAWGPPGAPGVSWGSWGAFVDYTARLLPGVGRDVVVAGSVAATVTEVVLGALLVCGWQRRWVGKATAGLFAVYVVTMSIGLGLDAVATFGLPVLVGGALLVSSSSVHRPPRPQPARALEPRTAELGSRP